MVGVRVEGADDHPRDPGSRLGLGFRVLMGSISSPTPLIIAPKHPSPGMFQWFICRQWH